MLTDVRNQVIVFSRKPGDKSKTRWVGAPLKESAGSIERRPVRHASLRRRLALARGLHGAAVARARGIRRRSKREPLKQNPSFFDAANVEVHQHFATSKDGTKIPYFEVGAEGAHRRGAHAARGLRRLRDLALAGLLRASAGAAWIERGGVYVQANLRGGGEYGPEWHEAAMKHLRQNAYDDLAAVAEDLVRRGVTTPKTLGIIGASNGGLLTSVMLTQRPELFGAVVSKVPLTDMQRFHKLLAGASWMSEYGDPDNAEDWAALSKFSPLHNVKRGRAVSADVLHDVDEATTASTPATPARWSRSSRRSATRRSTTRTSRAATAARRTSSSARTSTRSSTRSWPRAWV